MRAFHWNKMDVNKIKGTVWDEIGELDKEVKLDVPEFEKMFAAKVVARKKKDDAEKKKKPKKELVRLLDDKRAYNIDIGISRFRMSHDDIRRAVLALDESKLDMETLTKLLNLVPTPEDVSRVRGYEGDVSLLGHAERFCLALAPVPQIKARLELLMFKMSWSALREDCARQLRVVSDALTRIEKSKGLKRVLTLVLAFGNYLNGGSRKGGAYGFKLSTLRQINGTKSSDGKATLLHYLVQVCERDYPDALSFLEDLAPCEQGRRMKAQDVVGEVNKLRASLNRLKNMVKTAKDPSPGDPEPDMFKSIMAPFSATAQMQHDKLVATAEKAEAHAKELAVMFGEKEDTKWETLFEMFDNFRVAFEQAKGQLLALEEQRKKEEKRKKAEEERKRRMASRKNVRSLCRCACLVPL
ncbi:MAG: hypothetical protein MHM6MM_004881 [Cercozoa sp. M6MM]